MNIQHKNAATTWYYSIFILFWYFSVHVLHSALSNSIAFLPLQTETALTHVIILKLGLFCITHIFFICMARHLHCIMLLLLFGRKCTPPCYTQRSGREWESCISAYQSVFSKTWFLFNEKFFHFIITNAVRIDRSGWRWCSANLSGKIKWARGKGKKKNRESSWNEEQSALFAKKLMPFRTSVQNTHHKISKESHFYSLFLSFSLKIPCHNND